MYCSVSYILSLILSCTQPKAIQSVVEVVHSGDRDEQGKILKSCHLQPTSGHIWGGGGV